MNRIFAGILTVLVIAGALFFSYRERRKSPDDPESAIWGMWDQARLGKVEGYLDCFTGTTRAQLEATARGMGPQAFSDYLRASVSKVKGIAVFQVQRPAEGEASLIVEYVYQDQNERQSLALKLEAGVWRIDSVGFSQRIQPLIPYGKPVTEVQ